MSINRLGEISNYWQVEATQCVCVLGDDGKLFEIDANTGTISMTKPADVLEPITLTVLVKMKLSCFFYSVYKSLYFYIYIFFFLRMPPALCFSIGLTIIHIYFSVSLLI